MIPSRAYLTLWGCWYCTCRNEEAEICCGRIVASS